MNMSRQAQQWITISATRSTPFRMASGEVFCFHADAIDKQLTLVHNTKMQSSVNIWLQILSSLSLSRVVLTGLAIKQQKCCGN